MGGTATMGSTALRALLVRFAVSATTVPATAAVGTSIRFGGSVLPARPGGTVWLEGLWSNTWHLIGTARLTDHSSYAFRVVPTRVSTYVYRVYEPPDAFLAAGASAPFSVVTH
jgi:hypothetical protein